MSRTWRARAAATPFAVSILLLSLPGPAAGVCAKLGGEQPPVGTARIVFVGTVTAVTNRDRTALFHVEEIWKGPNLADPSTVYGGSIDPNVSMEDERTWQQGQRYLVFPSVDSVGNLLDNGCSPTSVYTPAFDALKPTDAHPPQGPPSSGPPGAPPIAAVFLLIVLCGTAFALVAFRAGRPHGSGVD
jgi:hypothetical protein